MCRPEVLGHLFHDGLQDGIQVQGRVRAFRYIMEDVSSCSLRPCW